MSDSLLVTRTSPCALFATWRQLEGWQTRSRPGSLAPPKHTVLAMTDRMVDPQKTERLLELLSKLDSGDLDQAKSWSSSHDDVFSEVDL